MYKQYTVLEAVSTGDPFRKKIVCRVLVGKPESKSYESRSLLNSVNEILTTMLYIFCLIWIKFSTSDFRKNLLSDCKFCENWCSTSCTSASGVNECLCVLSAFVM